MVCPEEQWGITMSEEIIVINDEDLDVIEITLDELYYDSQVITILASELDATPIIIAETDIQGGIEITPNDVKLFEEFMKPIIITPDDIDVSELDEFTPDNYHGTKKGVSEKILKEGWRVGDGNAVGSGVYFSVGGDSISRRHAKPELIKAKIAWGNVAYMDDRNFQVDLNEWCRNNGRARGGDAITGWGLSNGYHCVMQSKSQRPTVGVMLGRRGTYIKHKRIQIVEVKDVTTGNVRRYS